MELETGESIEGEPVVPVWTTGHTIVTEEK
jgi:hypothetical protein